jgi:hypothetical protein
VASGSHKEEEASGSHKEEEASDSHKEQEEVASGSHKEEEVSVNNKEEEEVSVNNKEEEEASGNNKEEEEEEEDSDSLNSQVVCPVQTTISDLAVLAMDLALELMVVKEAKALMPGTMVRKEKSLGTHFQTS